MNANIFFKEGKNPFIQIAILKVFTTSKVLSKPFDDRENRGDTVIGNDVWIGQNVTILPGVHIGDGAIIGANSTVGKDIPPYAVAVGNPIQIKKYRFDKYYRFFTKIKWWDKDIKTIKQIIPYLSNGTIDISKLESFVDYV